MKIRNKEYVFVKCCIENLVIDIFLIKFLNNCNKCIFFILVCLFYYFIYVLLEFNLYLLIYVLCNIVFLVLFEYGFK